MKGQIELVDYLRQIGRKNFNILDYIPTGSEKAIRRSDLVRTCGLPDRYVRNAIALARREIPILNLQRGRGYFIPDMNDEEDRKKLIRYVRQEESRLKHIGWSLKAARQTLRNCGIDWRTESEKKKQGERKKKHKKNAA